MIAVNVEPKKGGILMKELSSAAPLQARPSAARQAPARPLSTFPKLNRLLAQGLMHLKRIRRETGPDGAPLLTVLICPAPPPVAAADARRPSDAGEGEGLDLGLGPLPEAVDALLRKHELEPFTVAVPAESPATKDLWEAWCADARPSPHDQLFFVPPAESNLFSCNPTKTRLVAPL